MANNYCANQYDDAFRSKRMLNWEVAKEVPKPHGKYPKSQSGFTITQATDRGHLIENGKKSDKNPWGDFVGTWNLPKKIPGPRVRVPTARTIDAQNKLVCTAENSEKQMLGDSKNEQRKKITQQGPPFGASNTRSMNPKPDTEHPYRNTDCPYSALPEPDAPHAPTPPKPQTPPAPYKSPDCSHMEPPFLPPHPTPPRRQFSPAQQQCFSPNPVPARPNESPVAFVDDKNERLASAERNPVPYQCVPDNVMSPGLEHILNQDAAQVFE